VFNKELLTYLYWDMFMIRMVED